MFENIIKDDTIEQKEIKKRFADFISLRNKIIVWFSIIVFVIYYSFIIAVGSIPDVVGAKIGDSAVTLGIVIGVAIIAICLILTGLYVFIANTYLDRDLNAIIKDMEDKNMILDTQKED